MGNKHTKKPTKNYITDGDEIAPLDDAFFETATWLLPIKAPKQSINLRIDEATLAWFKSFGPGYQTRMQAVLTAYAQGDLQLTFKERKAKTKP